MHQWSSRGVFEQAYQHALRTYKRLHPPSRYCVDSTYVKNAFGRECVGRNPTDRGRKALKVSVATDERGVVHCLDLAPGNVPDVVLLQRTLAGMLIELDKLPLYGDRGYDSKKNRKICASFGLRDRIFRRKTKTTSRTNAKRIIVENTFSWLDKHRRLLFLYEQHSDIHRSFLLIALGNRVGARFLDADMRASVCTSA